jgi:rhodanese-related sulfurtransferase
LIDIREKFEFDTHKADSQNLINIPFSEIDENLEIYLMSAFVELFLVFDLTLG